MAPTVESPDEFRILDFEIESGDVVFVRLARGPAEIEAMFYAHLIGRVVRSADWIFKAQGRTPSVGQGYETWRNR